VSASDLIRLALSRLQEQVTEKQLHKELAEHVLAEAKLYPGRAKRGLPTR
jgi:Arc/MetJ-type ribon-helix-helix transcriptional regulator